MVVAYNITGEPKPDALFIALEGCQKGDRVIYIDSRAGSKSRPAPSAA